MKKFIIAAAFALALGAGAFAEEKKPSQHLKLYGFVRTYFAFDTRESSAGTEDLYYYMPKDRSLNAEGVDLNAVPSLRYSALTSRLGLDVLGYEFLGYKIGAKIEADFYALVNAPSGTSSKVTGTAALRLRQAFVTVAKNGRNWKVGQAWHPMAADLPDIFSLDSGVPFGPFSRTPQITFEGSVSKAFSISASAIWQMQYTSTGPDGAVADYLKYSCVPEMYLGLNFKGEKSLLRIGANMLSIKPRYKVGDQLVNDRLTNFNWFLYGQTKLGSVDVKLKSVYAHDGSHYNMVGGYGVTEIDADGNWKYCTSRTSSTWATFSFKNKSRWVPSLFLGYVKNFGTKDEILSGSYWWEKNSAKSVNQMWRVQPEVVYNLGKLTFGLELMVTGVQYGTPDSHKLASTDLHVVANHRIQAMVKYTF